MIMFDPLWLRHSELLRRVSHEGMTLTNLGRVKGGEEHWSCTEEGRCWSAGKNLRRVSIGQHIKYMQDVLETVGPNLDPITASRFNGFHDQRYKPRQEHKKNLREFFRVKMLC